MTLGCLRYEKNAARPLEPTATPTAPGWSLLVGAMGSNSKKPRVFPDQSCSAGDAMRSVSLVRGALDRLVAALGGCRAGTSMTGVVGATPHPRVPSHRAQLRARWLAVAG